MTGAELRCRLQHAVQDPGVTVTMQDQGVSWPSGYPPVPAAVLVPIVLGKRPGVLLTKRNERLSQHAGQVSFPGGRIDPADRDAEAAALREAAEEIALDPTQVELLGRLADHVTGTGFRITPVLGVLPPGLVLTPAPAEVEAVFELPIDVLLDPAAPQRRLITVASGVREFWVWPHPEHYIWGATAAILVHLAQRLRGDPEDGLAGVPPAIDAAARRR